MSFEEQEEVRSRYPGTSSALITPDKDPNDQPLIASQLVSDPVHSSGDSFKPLCRDQDEPFTPIKTAEAVNDFEPLPFRDNIAVRPSNNAVNNNLWQLVYSPLQANPDLICREGEHDDGEKKSPPTINEVLSNPENPQYENDAPEDTKKPLIRPQQVNKEQVKAGNAKPPTHPRRDWQMYHPPPYYWYHHYHYGYPHHYGSLDDQGRLAHPTSYASPPHGHYPHAYRSSSAYEHLGKPPYMTRYSQPPVHQDYITDVSNNDVICGRGGAVNNHPGNRRFRQFIQEFKHQYLNETKQRKPFVAMSVLQAVKNSNPPGRFLVKYPGGYLECSDDRAREKASQALREGAAKLRKQGYGIKNDAGEKQLDSTAEEAGLHTTQILLPNERVRSQGYRGTEYSSAFDPPRKKIKQEEV
ncbi:hypothetical protein ACHAWF_015106 [Thalassiosira exigua]